MEWASEHNPVERAADVAAAAVSAAAVAFAVGAIGAGAGLAIFAGAAGSVLVFAGLRRVSPGPRGFTLPAFEPARIELTEPPAEAEAELLLEDRLRGVNPDARVVRLFDPRHMPAAGDESPRSAYPDASQALSEALAELRRSLR